MSEAQERREIIEEALSWKGTPYHHMGRVKGAGVDCGMFLLEVFERARLIEHIEIPYYPFDIAANSENPLYLDWIRRYGKEVSREAIPGDVIIYRFPGSKVPHHAAILIDEEYIIHSYLKQGVVLSNRRGYQRYEIGVFSFWGR